MYIDDSIQVLGGHKTCHSYDKDESNDCHKSAYNTHLAFYDLDTPDIFVFTKKE